MSEGLVALLAGLGALLFSLFSFVYRRQKAKRFTLPAEKLRPKVSIALIVKNNQELLEHSIRVLLQTNRDFNEIIVLDLGSIDNSLEVAHKLLDDDQRAKIVEILKNTITADYFNLIKSYVTGETIFVLDLYKIGANNPQVYVPDLFKPLNSVQEKGFNKPDSRIDGVKLLYFDSLEREKNDYILKEYMIETLSNIRMGIETCWEKTKGNPKLLEEQVKGMQEYLDQSIEKITLMLRLLGPVKQREKSLDNNLLRIFKDYGQSHKIGISYKVLGNKRPFKEPVNNLILGVTQELLYTIVQYNLSSGIEVISRYTSNQLQILFRYDGMEGDNLLNSNNELSQFVLQSIQNRLSLIGGKIRVKVNNNGKVTLLLRIPMNPTTWVDRRKGK